jgi:micrococcal nuclease
MNKAKAGLYRYAAKLERVIDGDTLILTIDLGFHIYMQEHVRLFGVNTPEIYGPGSSEAGKDAHAYTEQWLAKAGPLCIVSRRYDAREKYGRVLAEVYREGDPTSLNDALINSGHGSAI